MPEEVSNTPQDSVRDRFLLRRMRTIGKGKGTYTICDPASRYTISSEGVAQKLIIIIPASTLSCILALGGALAVGAWFSDSGRWFIPEILFFCVGAFVGFFVGGLLGLGLIAGPDWILQYFSDRRRGGPRWLRIGDSESPAWKICDLTWQISRVSSWRDRTVDTDDKFAHIAWNAVERSVEAERQHETATRALRHSTLEVLAEDALTTLGPERAALRTVESNLRNILETAYAIDVDRQSKKERELEERELFGRLTNKRWRRATNSDTSALQAERAAGLAAETEAIAGWLAEADQILRDF